MSSYRRPIWLAAGAPSILALLIVGMLLQWGAAQATGVLFVAPSGNDLDSCMTMANACRTIPAAVGKASPGDTIIVAAGVYTEDISIEKDLTLIGFGADETIIDQGRMRVAYAKVNLFDLSITSRYGDWGALFNDHGTVTLGYTSILSTYACYGGGIYNSGGTLLVDHSIIAGNRVVLNGGGIENYGGFVSVSHSMIENNAACNRSCAPDTSGCVPNNVPSFSSEGGGIDNFVGILSIDNSTLIDNRAYAEGDGIYNIGTGTLFITNSTFTNNNGGSGDAIDGFSDVSLTNDTFSGNSIDQNTYYHGRTFMLNTIVAPSKSGRNNCEGTIISLGHNLSSDSSCSLTGTGDLPNTNPLLGPLQDNGGPTPTHALLAGSPAINHGDNIGCPPTDQRGITRPQAGICDIGAYEYVFPFTMIMPVIRR